MATIVPSGIVKFIESFHGQTTTGGEDHPSKCGALLDMVERLPEKFIPDAESFAAMQTNVVRLQDYVHRHKDNPSVAREMYQAALSRDVNPVREIWQLMKKYAPMEQRIQAEEEATNEFKGIYLDDEPTALLNLVVEASRKVPRKQREKFMVATHSQGSLLLHGGLSRQEEIYYGDVEALSREGFVALTFGGNNTPIFDVTSRGFRYYEFLKRQAGTPIQRVESELHLYLTTDQFSVRYPVALAKWREAEQLLWRADADAQFTAIGHHCREAMQEFAQELARSLGIQLADDTKAKTVAAIRQVVMSRRGALGEAKAEFLNALLAYWGTVSDLVQRQEHGSDKSGSPLQWEDARRVVFQTLLVMFELSRSL